MGVTWFLDLAGNPVVENSRPAGKIYVVDPEKLLEPEWVNFFVTPEPYEQVVRTNSEFIEEMAAHSGAHTSRGRPDAQGSPALPTTGSNCTDHSTGPSGSGVRNLQGRLRPSRKRNCGPTSGGSSSRPWAG